MADIDRMKAALVAADKAGDVEAATKLARAIKSAQQVPLAGGDPNAPRLDRKTGAPLGVRALVGGTDSPEDRLATLRNYFPDAEPYQGDNFVFTNPETGRPTLYNPPGFFSDPLGDAVSFAREMAQTVGGSIGGILGAGAGPGGVVAGTTVGTGVGEGLFNLGAQQFGLEDTRSPAQRGLETATTALTAGVSGGSGAVTGAGIRGGVRRVVRGADVEGVRSAIDDAARWGGTPSVATATTPERINGIEELVSKFPGGAGVFRNTVRKTNDKIAQGIRTRSAQIARRQDLDPVVAGKGIVEGVDDFVANFKKKGGDLFNALDQYVTPDAQVSTSNTKRVLDEIGDKIDVDAWNKVLTSGMTRSLREGTPDTVAYDVLKQMRSAVGDKMTTGRSLTDDIPTGDLKRLYGAITEDMKAAVGPDGLKAFERANRYWKAGMGRIDNVLAPVVRNKVPEKVFKAVESGAKDGPTTIRALRSSLDKDQWNTVVGTVVRRLGKVSSTADEANFGSNFSLQSFLTNWRRIDEASRRAMFNTPELRQYGRDLDALARWAARAEESSRAFANPSGTARATAGITMVGAGAAGPLLYPILGSSALGVTAAAGALVGGANISARMLTSPKVVRWLAQSTKMKPNGIGAHIGRLADVAAGEDYETAQAIQEYLGLLGDSNERD